jgi:hypothetical protein
VQFQKNRGWGVLLLTSYPMRIAVPRSIATRDLSLHPTIEHPDPVGKDFSSKSHFYEVIGPIITSLHLYVIASVHPESQRRLNQLNPYKDAKIVSYLGGDSVSTEAVAARRHAGTHLPVTWWKLEMPTTTWHLLLN